jgi:phosphoglycolate phosphatase-like HAD superfamily hydrolase
MIEKIYLDMDGVLCDFEKQFTGLYGEESLKNRDRKLWSEDWPNFIERKQFEELPKFPGCDELLEFVRKFPVEIEILTSSGGTKFHEQVREQKKVWLKKYCIAYKPHVVPGRKHKKEYATPETILIDDTPDVIDSFNKAGGIGILHKDVKETIKTLETLLNK